MYIEKVVDDIIEDIGRDWYPNGYFGQVRNDLCLIYEVARRLEDLTEVDEEGKRLYKGVRYD